MSKDFDSMSDDEFENMLDNMSSDLSTDTEPELDVDSIDEGTDDVDSGSEEYIEDTDLDQDDDSSYDNQAETNEDDDDQSQDTEDDDNEDESTDTEENSQNEADEPSMESNANDGKTEVTDYKEAYEKMLQEKKTYEDFYNEVTGEFVANGKVVRGPNDPKKIIQSLQQSAGFSDKMKAFKQYRPFLKPLREKGLLDNPDKFNLMINAIDGDPDAVKTLLKQSNIDPLEVDLDELKYEPTNTIASNIEVALDDVIDTAAQYGVKERVEEVISKDWDEDSVVELLNDPESSADLVSHLSNGVYDMVQQKIAQKKMSDPYGAYSNKRAIDQYREAAVELEQEYLQNQSYQAQQQQQMQQAPQFSEADIQAEMNRLREEQSKQDYSQKVNSNSEVDKARKKAASVSKRKPRGNKKRNEDFDPMKLSDDEFEDMLQSMMA
jgi:hypothetical protein